MINPRFLARELESRGITVEIVDVQEQVLRAALGEHVELFADVVCRLAPATSIAFATDKRMAKRVLSAAGFATPVGERFSSADVHDALAFAGRIGFPVVVKPSKERQGRGVETDLRSYAELEEAIGRLTSDPARPTFVVEKQMSGVELRVFITADGKWAAAQREPASVVGDGARTIFDLAALESVRRTAPRTNCLGPIELDDASVAFLRRHGKTPFDVPAPGERVLVRGHVDGQGAFVKDVTDAVHESVADTCRRALDAFALPYAGFDVRLLGSLDAPLEDGSYTILEVNVTPAFGLHLAPGAGAARNVVGAVVDMVFPETAPSRGTTLRRIS